MERKWIRILCLFSLILIIPAIYVDKDCLIRDKYDPAQLHDGSHTHIRAWFDGTNQSSSIINITLEFEPEGYPETYDIIEIWNHKIEVRRIRMKNPRTPQNLTIDPPLTPGWMEMIFESGDEFVFNFLKRQTHLYKCEGEQEKLRKIEVAGSYITVNCINDIIYWKIDNHQRIIPLELNIYNKFSIFSRKDYIPSIQMGEKLLQLGWNDGIINDISSFKEILQVPLYGQNEYFFKIGCINGTCKSLLGGKDDGQAINVPSSSTMAVSGRSVDSFILLLHLETVLNTKAVAVTSPLPITEKSNDNILTSVVIIALTIALVAVVIVLAFFLWKSEKKIKNSTNSLHCNGEECHPMIEKRQPSLTRQNSLASVKEMDDLLWNAVVQNNIELVRTLLGQGKNPANKEPNTPTSPQQEAHLLGNKQLTTLFEEHLKIETSTVSEELIQSTMKILETRMTEVFTAAKYGQYERKGVNVLLKTHSLPGTIRNSNGWSLVHYIAAASFSDERPAWEPTDIRNFFNDQKSYINAIDHWGNTALHILATQKGNIRITWDGRELIAKDAWIEIAKILIEYGCDPRIANHQNLLPHETATNYSSHDMSSYLKKISENKGPIDHKEAADKYKDILVAVKQSDVSKMINLLNEHVPMLPMFAEEDLLAEALRSSNVETVFLLLGAGVPICNCSIDDLTPLEVAHNKIGLPALFPALMRKVYADRLEDEKIKITSNDDSHQKLKRALDNIKEDILSKGWKCKWKFESKEKLAKNVEAKEMLCVASTLGLSLAVQLLGLEDVQLHPLPGEENPVQNAQSGDHIDTVYSLFRDLKIAPFTTPNQGNIPEKLLLDFWISEYEIFKRNISEENNQLLLELDSENARIYHKRIKELKSSTSKHLEFDSKFLYMLSRYGLVYLLHQVYTKNGIDINQIIQPFSGCTMLHISSHYGHLHLTEYLLYRGADPSIKTIGDFTAAHIAGIAGQEETMNLLLSYIKHININIDTSCLLTSTAEQLFEKYCKMFEKCNFQLMETYDAFLVKNELHTEDKAYHILKKKGNILKIKYKDDLVKTANNLQKDSNSSTKDHAKCIEKEMSTLINALKGTSFQGALRGHGQYHEGNTVFPSCNDVLKFMLELDQFSAIKEGKNISLTQKEKESMVFSINAKADERLFKGRNFMKDYINTFKDVIKGYKSSSDNICLAPPFLLPYQKGVILFWVWFSENSYRQIRTFIEPVIKADWPSKEGLKNLPEDIQKNYTSEDYVHLHLNNIDGLWTYRAYNLVREIFENLSDDEREVWIICRLLTLVIKKHWWAPHFNGRKSASWSVGVDALPDRVLRTLFLKELAPSKRNEWGKKDAYEHVCNVFNHAVDKDEKGNHKFKEHIEPVTLPLTPLRINDSSQSSVLGIIKYLEELPSESPKTLRKLQFADQD